MFCNNKTVLKLPFGKVLMISNCLWNASSETLIFHKMFTLFVSTVKWSEISKMSHYKNTVHKTVLGKGLIWFLTIFGIQIEEELFISFSLSFEIFWSNCWMVRNFDKMSNKKRTVPETLFQKCSNYYSKIFDRFRDIIFETFTFRWICTFLLLIVEWLEIKKNVQLQKTKQFLRRHFEKVLIIIQIFF